MRCFVVMGVAGCGKSTIGAAVAAELDASFVEGDALHPPGNIAKMSAGAPLTDADRAPWLDKVGLTLKNSDGLCLVACSALRRRYRDRIRIAAAEPVAFLHLAGPRAVIEKRMASRKGHFMPVTLLDSQFATLEPLQPDEAGQTVGIDQDLPDITNELLRYIRDRAG